MCSGSASGAASLHANVTVIDNPAIFWSTYVANSTNFQINANTTYSLCNAAQAAAVAALPLLEIIRIGDSAPVPRSAA